MAVVSPGQATFPETKGGYQAAGSRQQGAGTALLKLFCVHESRGIL